MDFDKKIDELFLDLPEITPTAGIAANVVQTGKLVFLSGVLPMKEGRLACKGRVGLEVNAEAGRMAAHAACVLSLGILRNFLGGSLNKVRQIVSLRAFVASGAEFKDHQKIADGALELLSDIFGNAGKPARAAVGVTALPSNATVELEMIVEIK
jgi:enamine deaminase RidA (YjgF/YER057c/UK114 family)